VALGVYVHIPFCASKCDYCDFATWTDRSALIDDYVDACVTDLRARTRSGDLDVATSVFVGGGTPSLLPADALARILDEIPRAPDAEVTVECNPESVDGAKLARYRVAGVNRCSFGVQSFRAHVLAALGRGHDVPAVTRAVDAARELDRMGLLPDSRSRPGKPLRDKLRAGQIEHTHQENGFRWFIRCGRASV